MAFSIFCVLESMILIMNAIVILNDRFLKKGKSTKSNAKFNHITFNKVIN